MSEPNRSTRAAEILQAFRRRLAERGRSAGLDDLASVPSSILDIDLSQMEQGLPRGPFVETAPSVLQVLPKQDPAA